MKLSQLLVSIIFLATTWSLASMHIHFAAQHVAEQAKTPAQKAAEEAVKRAQNATQKLESIFFGAASPIAMYEFKYRLSHYGSATPEEFHRIEIRKRLEEQYAEIEHLLAQGANPNIQFTIGTTRRTPLSYAAAVGATRVVNSLVNAGANVKTQDNNQLLHPLTWAVKRNYPAIVEILLKAKADPNIFVEGQISALEWAAKNGNYPIVKLLLEAGANPNIEVQQAFVTPLTWAAHNDNPEMVEILLQAGAGANFLALSTAAKKGNYKISKLLLDAGARIPEDTPNVKAEIRELIRSYTQKQTLP